jgi:hypothetical protein
VRDTEAGLEPGTLTLIWIGYRGDCGASLRVLAGFYAHLLELAVRQ